MDWKNINVEKMAQEISKNYIQPHILIRWLMLYREVMKIPLFIEVLKGNLESKAEIIPLTNILCEQILDEIKITPENLKYLPETEEMYKILCKINYSKIDTGNIYERKCGEEEALKKFKDLQLKIFKLFQLEKHNIEKANFHNLKKDNAQELLFIFNMLNSQIENLLL